MLSSSKNHSQALRAAKKWPYWFFQWKNSVDYEGYTMKITALTSWFEYDHQKYRVKSQFNWVGFIYFP